MRQIPIHTRVQGKAHAQGMLDGLRICKRKQRLVNSNIYDTAINIMSTTVIIKSKILIFLLDTW